MATIATATAGALVLACAGLAARSHIPAICQSLVFSKSHLPFPASSLGTIDVIFILVAVVFKSFLAPFGLVPRLEFWREERAFTLPAIEISAPVRVEPADLARYRDAVAAVSGSAAAPKRGNEEDAPPSLLLVALTTPLMLLALANYRSPILPLGSVNTKNRFEYLVPDVRPFFGERMVATARTGGPRGRGRQTRRGIEFDIVVEVLAYGTGDSAPAQPVFRQHITIMQTLPKILRLTDPKPSAPPAQVVDQSRAVSSAEVKVPYHAPRVWARLCKDYNPIHVSALAARVFGYPGRMAHGNHALLAAYAAMAQDATLRSRSLKAMDVAFKRPMVLPITTALSYQTAEDGKVVFELHKGEKTYVEGSLTLD